MGYTTAQHLRVERNTEEPQNENLFSISSPFGCRNC